MWGSCIQGMVGNLEIVCFVSGKNEREHGLGGTFWTFGVFDKGSGVLGQGSRAFLSTYLEFCQPDLGSLSQKLFLSTKLGFCQPN